MNRTDFRTARKPLRVKLLVFLVATKLLSTTSAADVEIAVTSPVAGMTYYASLPGGELSAEIGLELGEGPWASAIRAAPSGFELCVHWGTGSGGRGDGGISQESTAIEVLSDGVGKPAQRAAPPACRSLVSPPGHVDVGVPNLRPSGVTPGHHTFVAHIRATPGVWHFEILQHVP